MAEWKCLYAEHFQPFVHGVPSIADAGSMQLWL
jgi:hypothetical protein